MTTRGRSSRARRACAMHLLAAAVMLLCLFGGDHVARAHQYCARCVQKCYVTTESGCEVYYPNVGAYTKATCLSGGTTCTMTYSTTCYTMKKICSQSTCSSNDCQGGVCTTYTISAVDASMQYSGNTTCPD